MNDELVDKLEQEILKFMAQLSQLEPGTKEYEATEKTICDLAAKVNEAVKVKYDYDQKVCKDQRDNKVEMEKFEKEMELKHQELDAKIKSEKEKRRNDMIVEGGKACIEIAGIVIPLKFYAKFLEQGYLFEKEGIISSATFKNLLHFIKPKR